MNFKNFQNLEPFEFNTEKKKQFFQKHINQLVKHHYNQSQQYKKLLNFLKFKIKNVEISKLPFLPVKLFKYYDLKSVPDKNLFKTMMSSGTSQNLPSKIYLDKENAYNQVKVLSKIIKTILGHQRLPMLIIDANINKVDRNMFSAKTAAIKGFSIFGSNHTYLLNDKDEIDYKILESFLSKYGKQSFFIFGFTSNIYEHLIKNISTKNKYNFEKGILLHGGGWKKMENIKISNKMFKKKLNININLYHIFNYYGLIEQTGSIFLECPKCNCFVVSIFSDVLIRDKDLNIVDNGKKGMIQLFSLLPTSYPGHIILTEDIGEIVDNDCTCSHRGKRFKVHGRSKTSEIRGCSDI